MSNDIQALLERLQKEHGFEYELKDLSAADWQQMQVDAYNDSEGNLHEFDGYNCKACKNRGYFAYIDPNGYEVHRPCKCQRIRNTLRLAKRSGLGDILSDFTFEKYIISEDWQQKIKDIAQAFCNDDIAKWFYIGGQSGAGKTHICTAIAAHYIKQGRDTKYMLWCEESKKLKAVVNEYEQYKENISILKNAEVLYIDDFLKTKGGETVTNADINLAFEILNSRMLDKDKITIISSEKTISEVLEYDEATMSRIYKQAGSYLINIEKDRKKNYRLRG